MPTQFPYPAMPWSEGFMRKAKAAPRGGMMERDWKDIEVERKKRETKASEYEAPGPTIMGGGMQTAMTDPSGGTQKTSAEGIMTDEELEVLKTQIGEERANWIHGQDQRAYINTIEKKGDDPNAFKNWQKYRKELLERWIPEGVTGDEDRSRELEQHEPSWMRT